jgi:hypothetical protein
VASDHRYFMNAAPGLGQTPRGRLAKPVKR